MLFPSPHNRPPVSRNAQASALHRHLLESCPRTATSHYMDPSGVRLRYPKRPGDQPDETDRQAVDALRAHVLDADYPCLMSRSVFNRDAFRLSTYGELGHADNAALLCDDLYAFCAEFPAPVQGAVSFIACFGGAMPGNEIDFEIALWRQLQAIHDVDRRRFSWCAEVDCTPDSPKFSFSVGGRAFFIIGMHPQASRLARRTPMPAIVFNLHEQFVELRASGKFDGVRDKVQARDKLLQGSINPMAADFGERSEVAQYSGRSVGTDWVCPFNPA